MTPARLLLTLFGLATVVDLGSLAVGADTGHLLTKPLLMPLLAVYAALRGAPRLLIAAVLCGWAGDTLLLSDADPAFLAGMAAFAAGHVCYLVLFTRIGTPREYAALLAPAYAAALVGTVVLLWPDLPRNCVSRSPSTAPCSRSWRTRPPPGSASWPGWAARSSCSPTP